jgi:hypothetical protein
MRTAPEKPIQLPPAPIDGGPLELAPAKVGEWVWQPKLFDDWRAIVHVQSRTVWNAHGLRSSINAKVRAALDTLTVPAMPWIGDTWLDVGLLENRSDLMRGCIVIFDLISPYGEADYLTRRKWLDASFTQLPEDMASLLKAYGGKLRDYVYLINDWRESYPMELQAFLQKQNAEIGHNFFEGLVAKRMDAPYPPGNKYKQITPYWIKHRFL